MMADVDADLTLQQTPEELGIPPAAPPAPPPPALPFTSPLPTSLAWPGGAPAVPPDARGDATSDQGYDLKSLGPLIEQQQEMNRQAIENYRRQLAQPLPQPPRPQQLGPPPKPGIDPQAASQWLAAAGVLGAISGLGSRKGAMAGLNAFTGTLNGLKAGNQQQYENSVKEWNQQSQHFATNAKQEWDQYEAIIKRRDLSAKQAAQMVELQAMANNNQFMAQVARKAVKDDNLALLATTLDTSGKTMATYFESGAKLEQQHQNQLDAIDRRGQWEVEAARERFGTQLREKRSQAGDISGAIMRGEQPPVLTSLGTVAPLVRQDLAKSNWNLQRAQLDWQRAQVANRNLNSVQRQNFFALANDVDRQLDRTIELGEQLRLTGVPLTNWATLQRLAKANVGEQSQLAARYVSSITTSQELFGSLVRGGYTPTNESFELAFKQIDPNMNIHNLQASLSELKNAVKYRKNAMLAQGAGPGVPNPYGGTQPDDNDYSIREAP